MSSIGIHGGASGGAGSEVVITDGVDDATVRDLPANDALNVAIVDANGDQITSFGGGTQYTEGDVDATITGTAAMMEVAGNTLQPVQGTVADGLLVNLGANNDVTVTGTVTANAGSGTFTSKEIRSSTATTSQVADTASSTTLLAANTDRLGATIANDSSAVLFVKFGTTASSTDYSARLPQYAYLEIPYGYTGRIDGIWASDPNDGAARITEFT